MRNGSEPLVSVLIPCYNAGKWVGDAIGSALAQTYRNREVIVLDDGSTDGSGQVIRSFGDRIRWEKGPNRGAPGARNRLLELSRGEWVQFLDADDCLLPLKLERQIGVVRQTPCDLVASPCDSDAGITSATAVYVPWVDLLDWNLGNGVGNLWRKQAILDVGGWEPSQPSGQDYELMFRVLKEGARVAYWPEALAYARDVNPESVSRCNPSRAARVRNALVAEAADFAVASGLLPSVMPREAGRRLFSIARRVWRHGSTSWRELERLASCVDPDLKASLWRTDRVYGKLYRVFGFSVAQWYLRLSEEVRRVLAKALRDG